jgi:hypothetical protein
MCAGVQDAYASAGTFAITNYMDLGSGVLILWSVAVRPAERIPCSTFTALCPARAAQVRRHPDNGPERPVGG